MKKLLIIAICLFGLSPFLKAQMLNLNYRRETSERNRGESRGVRTEVSSASESRGRQPGERTEVREPDVP